MTSTDALSLPGPFLPAYSAVIEGWRPTAKTHGQNARRHWGERAKTARQDRFRAVAALHRAQWPRVLPWPRAVLWITLEMRRGKLMDDDNVTGVGKSIRDGIANYFDCTDAPDGPITWRYRAIRGSADRVVLTLEEG